MGDIAQYIASENYESLIHAVLGVEYSIKDKKDVLKFIKRKNATNKVSSEIMYKLRVSCGDLSDVVHYYKITTNAYDYNFKERAKQDYRNLLSFCPVEMIFEQAPDLFFHDSIFVEELCSIAFNAGLHPGISDFNLAKKICNQLAEVDSYSFKSSILEYLVLCMIYNFSSKAAEFNSLLISQPSLKYIYTDVCSSVFDRRRHYISQELKIAKNILCAYQGMDVFSDEFKEIVYNKACSKANDPDCVEAVQMILNSGFKKITSGFNTAVGIWDENMVKTILPYKPKLDKALSLQTSPSIMSLLAQAAEQRAKKKKAD